MTEESEPPLFAAKAYEEPSVFDLQNRDRRGRKPSPVWQ